MPLWAIRFAFLGAAGVVTYFGSDLIKNSKDVIILGGIAYVVTKVIK